MADKMQLAEALTSASKSLERTQQRVEEVGRILKALGHPDKHNAICNEISAQLAIANRNIRSIANE